MKLIDLGWHRELVTLTDGKLAYRWTHWVKPVDGSRDRYCDAITETKP